MKILEALGEPIADGGQESFVFGVIDKIDMTGFEIDCLTAYDCRSERYQSMIKNKGGKIYTLNLPFTPGKSRYNIRAPFTAFLQQHHYDVVHIHSGSISVLAIMAEVADRAGVQKVIVHSHCTGDKDDIKHKVLRRVASISMKRHVDVFCACSVPAAEWKFEPSLAKKALIIKNGIDVSKFSFSENRRKLWREKLNYTNEVVIGNVGRFGYQKNQTFLVEIFEKLARQESNIKLLLVGDGEDRELVQQLVKYKGLDKKVTFTGSVANVEDYLQAMDIFVLPSRFEGLPVVVVEALSAGLMAIISDHVPSDGLCPERIRIVSLDETADVWADTIMGYLDHVGKSRRLIAQPSGFDIRDTVEEIRKLYLIS